MKGALLLVATTLGAVGCADNDLSMSVTQMEAITTQTQCVAMAVAGSTSVGRSRGLLDVSLVTTSGYIGVPVIRNNLPNHMTATGVEYNSIQLQGANITLITSAGGLSASQQKFFYAAAPGHVDPGLLVPMFVEVIPAATAKQLAASIPANGLLTVTAEIRPVGMRDGDQIVGGPIDFPIDICNNCLVQNAGTCPMPKGSVPELGGCFVQQDDPITCCTDTNGAVLCGSAVPIASM